MRPRPGVVQRPDGWQRPAAGPRLGNGLRLSVSQRLSVRFGRLRPAVDGSGADGGLRRRTGRQRLRIGEAGGPRGHDVVGNPGQAVVAGLGQIVIATFG